MDVYHKFGSNIELYRFIWFLKKKKKFLVKNSLKEIIWVFTEVILQKTTINAMNSSRLLLGLVFVWKNY